MLDQTPSWPCREDAQRYAEMAEAATGIPASDILGKSKLTHIVAPRRWVIARLREQGYSTTKIGHALGVDHTTVMHHLGMTKASRDVKRWKDGA